MRFHGSFRICGVGRVVCSSISVPQAMNGGPRALSHLLWRRKTSHVRIKKYLYNITITKQGDHNRSPPPPTGMHRLVSCFFVRILYELSCHTIPHTQTKLKERMHSMKVRARRLSSELGATSLSQAAKSVAAATLGEFGGVSPRGPGKALDNDSGDNDNEDDDGDNEWRVYREEEEEEEAGTEGKIRRHTRRRSSSMVCVAS